MGFTISNYSLLGLPIISNIYVSIHGGYTVQKSILEQPNIYNISFTIYYHAYKESPVITQYNMSFNIQALPNPAVLYLIIYDYIKGQLDPQQTLTFTDD